MTAPDATVEAYYRALQARRGDAVAPLLTQECLLHAPGASLSGRDAVAGWMDAFFHAFPDITHEHGEITADGDRFQCAVRVQGTHTGPLVSAAGAIPPSGRQVTFQSVNELHVVDTGIDDLRIEFDMADFMRQIGAGD